MALFVVIGPPAAGKSTWVQDHAKPGDVIIDYDRIAVALQPDGVPDHGHKRPIATVAYQAREAAIREAVRHTESRNVYIIHSVPRPPVMAKYKAQGAEIVTVDPGRDVVMARCRRERSSDALAVVERWYRSRPMKPTKPKSVLPTPKLGGSRIW